MKYRMLKCLYCGYVWEGSEGDLCPMCELETGKEYTPEMMDLIPQEVMEQHEEDRAFYDM